jgi:cellulose synthase/poly-beta-1,6-N-acetylglucosamine synthase-like glycosyltransferase
MDAIILVLLLVSLVLFLYKKKKKKERDLPNHVETTSCRVSVVIITLNEELQIRECVEHVASFDPPCKEIIVSDGGSVDQTVSIIQSLVTDGQDDPPLSLVLSVQCKEKREGSSDECRVSCLYW